VRLTVRNFCLPDAPTAKTLVNLGDGDVSERYTGIRHPNGGTVENNLRLQVRDKHFQIAHGHKLSMIDSNTGAGNNTKSMATINSPNAQAGVPDLSAPASWMDVGDPNKWQSAHDYFAGKTNGAVFMYNGKHPASGSFATKDNGVALRELTWVKSKKNINR